MSSAAAAHASPSADTRIRFDLEVLGAGQWLIGIDEVGYGAWAGPLVAAAVAIHQNFYRQPAATQTTAHWRDSKKLPPATRQAIASQIAQLSSGAELICGIGEVPLAELVQINHMGRSNRLAMSRAYEQVIARLQVSPGHLAPPPSPVVLIDGRPQAQLPFVHRAVVKGDDRSLAIAAASNLAKVTRDASMVQAHERYPAYGFATNKGYPAPAHIEAILRQGPCPLHRPAYLRKLFARTQQTELPFDT